MRFIGAMMCRRHNPFNRSIKVVVMKLNAFPFAAMAGLGLFIAGCSGAETKAADPASGSDQNAALEADRARDGALGDMVLGNPDAKVTLIEYASFTCGHCKGFHETVLPGLKERFVETGQVKFIFRELPTAPQQLSYIGSVLARCAADRGGDAAFFAVADGLFAKQREWAFGNEPKLELLKITNQAGMDEAAIDTCLQRQEIVDVINANVTEASERYEVGGTPSFVLNDEKLNLTKLADLNEALTAAVEAAGGTVPADPADSDASDKELKTDPTDETGD
ncbi:MAG: thioredoxin domain-containing protein [Pseudomonadota bacterium]